VDTNQLLINNNTKANIKRAKFRKFGDFRGGLNSTIKGEIAKTFVIPHLENGVSVPDKFTQTQETAFEVSYKKISKSVLGFARNIPSNILYGITKFNPLKRLRELRYRGKSNYNSTSGIKQKHRYVERSRINLKPRNTRKNIGNLFPAIGKGAMNNKSCGKCGEVLTKIHHYSECAISNYTSKHKIVLDTPAPKRIKSEKFDERIYDDPEAETVTDNTVRIYTDASGDPKSSDNGYSFIFVIDGIDYQIGRFSSEYNYDITRLEIMAIASSLYYIKKNKINLNGIDNPVFEIYCDNENAVKTFQRYKQEIGGVAIYSDDEEEPDPMTRAYVRLVKQNRDVLDEVEEEILSSNFTHVYGHKGNRYNEMADFYSREAKYKKSPCCVLEKVILPPILNQEDTLKQDIAAKLKTPKLKKLHLSSELDTDVQYTKMDDILDECLSDIKAMRRNTAGNNK